MRAKFINESYLKIYRHFNNNNEFSILSGTKLFIMSLENDIPMKWVYHGEVNKDYTINGSLVKKPSIKMISIIQKKIKDNEKN